MEVQLNGGRVAVFIHLQFASLWMISPDWHTFGRLPT